MKAESPFPFYRKESPVTQIITGCARCGHASSLQGDSHISKLLACTVCGASRFIMPGDVPSALRRERDSGRLSGRERRDI